MTMQNTQLIVLKRSPHGETSSLLHGYSRDFGKMIFLAKGARSEKSPWRGLLEPFSVLNVHFNEKKGRAYQFLSQAEYIHPFSGLKSHQDAVLYGSVILELMYKIQDVQPDPELYDLIYKAFFAMDRGLSPFHVHAWFILHYLRMEGLALDAAHCCFCGKEPDPACFLPFQGQISCAECGRNQSPLWELPDVLLSLLKDMIKKDITNINTDRLNAADTLLLNRLLWNTLAARFENCLQLKSADILRKVL
jgi:DNA repair protein RecO (recombination protein O)